MRRAAIALATGLVIGACGSGGNSTGSPDLPAPTPPGTGELASTTTIPAPSIPAPTTTTPDTSATISDVDASLVPDSWREGCPVPLADLALVEVPFIDYEGETQRGRVVIAQDWADHIAAVFLELHRARFPIQRMDLIDAFGGDDDASMVANNTSGFNCRTVAGSDRLSDHAFGLAIDINPLVNPYVRSPSDIQPVEGARFADRDSSVPGLIVEGDAVVQAFDAIGWEWGGRWAKPDYQHFSAP